MESLCGFTIGIIVDPVADHFTKLFLVLRRYQGQQVVTVMFEPWCGRLMEDAAVEAEKTITERK